MRAALGRVDVWCRGGDFTVEDIAMFRIIAGLTFLLTLQQVGWIADVPASQFDPPPGPMSVFGSAPPRAALELLELATAVLAALLVLGIRTRTVSILLTLALGTGFGLIYSFGKIDHTIVTVLVPATMAFSGWGRALSVDAARGHDAVDRPVEQWPMRLLALMIGLSFVTAGVAKVRTGWLDLDTQAVQGHFARGYFSGERTDWLAPQLVDVHVGRLWEAADWFTVALELGLLLTVFWWRLFRIAVAVAALFHVGVLLMMGIVFSWNMVGYGAFVRWSTFLPTVKVPARLTRLVGHAAALVVGIGTYLVHDRVGPGLQLDFRTGIVFPGGAIAAAYLVTQARWMATGREVGAQLQG